MRHHRVMALAFTLLIASPAALPEGFPGKGDPDGWSDALPYFNRGNRYLQKEQFQQAAEDFQQAISKYGFDPDFYTNLGIAYRKLGDYEHSEQSFKKALELNEKDWMPWSDLANVYLKQNKLKEAIATFQRTLKCNPPPAEKAAIQQDILDINKILRMQQPPPKIPATTKAKAKHPISNTPATPVIKSAEPITSGKSASAIQPKQLKGTGWDWVYDDKK